MSILLPYYMVNKSKSKSTFEVMKFAIHVCHGRLYQYVSHCVYTVGVDQVAECND